MTLFDGPDIPDFLGKVTWRCPECQEDNEDNYFFTGRARCHHCRNATSWKWVLDEHELNALEELYNQRYQSTDEIPF